MSTEPWLQLKIDTTTRDFPDQPVPLIDTLTKWVKLQPDKILFTFLDDKADKVEKELTYKQFDEQSSRMAAYLVDTMKLEQGERVMLVYPPALDFIIAFVGCLKAGIIAVPAYPPDPSKLNKEVKMFSQIAKSSGAKTVITSSMYNYVSKLATVKSALSGGVEWPEMNWVVSDPIFTTPVEIRNPERFERTPPEWYDKVAFLQYTSGSTGDPKGVMITHNNIAHNCLTISIVYWRGFFGRAVVVSWLPQYHDMGLITAYLNGGIYVGGRSVLTTPITFVKDPASWVKTMSKYKATHSGAPNFAYHLTARKFLALKQRAQMKGSKINPEYFDLDLSTLRCMANAAEPVEASAIDFFYATFAEYGLKRGAITPTFGLAESTVFVCGTHRYPRLWLDKKEMEQKRIIRELTKEEFERYPETDKVILCGCGDPLLAPGVEMQIVDHENMIALGEKKVGEVWIKSGSCAIGYWNLPERSQETFNGTCTLLNGSQSSGYMRTGDLGFFYDGEIFICGRIKDLIIVRGRNHYPQDIERTCEAVGGANIRPGCSAAFSIPQGGEEVLVYICELYNSVDGSDPKVQRNLQAIMESMRRECSRVHGVTISYTMLIQPRTIIKTTSGKISRTKNKIAYLSGQLKEVAFWSSLENEGDNPDDDFDYADQSSKKQVELDEGVELKDPTELDLQEICSHLAKVVAKTMGIRPDQVDLEAPLSALGMDSIGAANLQGELDKTFTIQVPMEIIFEPETTLSAMAMFLKSGGKFKRRAIMVKGWEIFQMGIERGNSSGSLPSSWFRDRGLKTHIETSHYPDGAVLELAPLKASEDLSFILFSLYFFGMFFLIPVAIAVAFFFLEIKIFAGVVAGIFVLASIIPSGKFPSAYQRSKFTEMVSRYFSYRVIMENQNINTSVPTIYTLAPCGIFPIAHALHTLVNEYCLGSCFRTMIPGFSFYVPFYGAALKAIGFIPYSKKSLTKRLNDRESVAIVPGGKAEMGYAGRFDPLSPEVLPVRTKKDFIKVALQTGAQIVPCYSLGNNQTFTVVAGGLMSLFAKLLPGTPAWVMGRFGLTIPYRTPLTTIIGKPILCPQVSDPSPELISEYHDLYLKETRRLFMKYRNTMNWNDKPLTIQK